jgi:hypothetical protein
MRYAPEPCRQGDVLRFFWAHGYLCAVTIGGDSPYVSASPRNVLLVSPDQSFCSYTANHVKKEVSPSVMSSSPRLVDDEEPTLPIPDDVVESFQLALASVDLVERSYV